MTIDLFEKQNRIGGRVKSITFDGDTYEAGGAIIIAANKYMVGFAKKVYICHSNPL